MELVKVYCNGDWDAFYLDGKCVWQDHASNVILERVIEYLIARGDHSVLLQELNYDTKHVDEDWMNGKGGFPPKLKDVRIQLEESL